MTAVEKWVTHQSGDNVDGNQDDDDQERYPQLRGGEALSFRYMGNTFCTDHETM